MKRIIISLIAAAALPTFAAQAADNKEHPPEKAMDSATPEMKNPGGAKDLHPPQKAMDEATPADNAGGDGASTGSSGAADVADWDIRKAGEGVTLNSKSAN